MGQVGFLEEEAGLELEGEDWKRWVGTRRMKGSKAAPRRAPTGRVLISQTFLK